MSTSMIEEVVRAVITIISSIISIVKTFKNEEKENG